MYIFRGRGVFIDVYKADDKIATSGATSLSDIDMQRTYRAIDSVATGRLPSLFCAVSLFCDAWVVVEMRRELSFFVMYPFSMYMYVRFENYDTRCTLSSTLIYSYHVSRSLFLCAIVYLVCRLLGVVPCYYYPK